MKKIFTFLVVLNLSFVFHGAKAQSETEVIQNQEVKNLTAFAKSYGYIRFFYPNTVTEDFNWEAFLVYGTREVRNLKTDRELKTVLSDLFSSIAPHAIFSNNENTTLEVKPISQGDSITFWQHSSFSMNQNLGVKLGGHDIKILVKTASDSSQVIRADSPLLKDEVQFEFIAYSNFNKYYYPDNFREPKVNDDYVLNKQPDPSLPFSSKLIDDLWIIMPLVLQYQEAKHPTQKVEIEAFSKILEEFYSNKNALYNEDDIRYADFILIWNAIHHLYPYRKRAERLFDFYSSKQLRIGLEQISKATDKKKVSYSAIRNYVSLLHDPHASVSRVKTQDEKNQNSDVPTRVRSWLPFYRMYSDGRVYVLKSFDPKIKMGDEILEINNEPVSMLMDKEIEKGVGSLHQKLYSAANTIGSLFNASKGTIKLKRNNEILKIEVNTISRKEYFTKFRNPFEHKTFEYPTPKTIYINPSLLSDGDLNEKFDELVNAEHLIIDLRAYPKSVKTILDHLPIADGFLKGLILSNPLNMYPNQEQQYHIWQSSLTVLKKPAIAAKIIVLIGSSISSTTISRGETFASYFKDAGATLIGDSKSVGASGGLTRFTTPGNIKVFLTSSYTVRSKGQEMQSIGITPDILVKQTLSGLKEGKDQVYEAALKMIKE